MTLNIKQRSILVVAGVTAAALCVAAAPSAMADAGTKSVATVSVASPASAKADGERVFRGLFFGQGEVGSDLSKLDLFAEARQHVDNEDLDEVRASNAVVDLINKRSPAFFAELSAKTRSGDPRQVEKAVTDAQNMLMSVAQKDDKATPVENGQLCGVTVAVGAAVVHIAAVVTAAGAVVTVTVAVGANFVKGKNWFWSPQPTTGDGTPLSKDEAVAQVTKALKAA
ncbi:sporulation delaying protein family toxin [Streptomyces sp. ISL-43]|uniref:sporulation delaying protein family toxin n=1 Tax=Streptomyces sp. ISL-43 TaxID=2819183 RepID=UPI001BE665D6|nr:sporulation delaying protein family toxin [Streptomyces sp. ISL-43]MBT2446256.1 sporulation delaying protein family toxin [Streptomyces sp. ISL-43]